MSTELRRQDGGRLVYQTAGAGQPVLFVTGLNGVAAHWAPQISMLSKSRLTIAFDQRGCGNSDKSSESCSIEQVAQDALSILDALGMEKADFVGHSLGGAVGQYLAAYHPKRIGKLVLLSSWLSADVYFRKVMTLRRELLRAAGENSYVLAGSAFLYPPAWLADHEAMIRANEEKIIAAFPPKQTVLDRIDAVLRFDGRVLPSIAANTLLMVAADDILTPPYMSRQLADRISGCSLQVTESGAHMFTQINAAAVNTGISDFLGT